MPGVSQVEFQKGAKCPAILDVRAEWSPFSALPGIWLAPFFQQNVYEWPNFSVFLCERPHFSDILVHAHIFRSEIFRSCLFSWYSKNWLRYIVVVRIFNATRHPRHIEAAAIVMMYMYLYSLAFMDHPCTLGAAACHQAPPCPLYTQPRARRVWARRTNGLKIVSIWAGFKPTISRLKVKCANH